MDAGDVRGHAPAKSYTLLRKLATGGMAELYLGKASGISGVEKIVAIKRILPQFATNQKFVTMFLDEARIAATLQHPNIVQMYDVVQGTDGYFIVMEFLHGADVRAIAKTYDERGLRLPLEQILHVLFGVLNGLHYAHERHSVDGKALNIVHRDVSPQNVFVTFEGTVKMLDFGIAKASNCMSETQVGTLKGKVAYMSPEQCLGQPLDRRSDVYSVGVMLYELLTRRRTHRGPSSYALMRAIVDEPVIRPSTVIPAVPPELDRVVLKALAKRRRDRYQTARDFQIDLEHFARSAGYFISPIAMSQFMTTTFPEQSKALLETPGTASQVVRLDTGPTPGPVTLGGTSGAGGNTFDFSGEMPTGIVTDHASVEQHGNIQLVHLKGRLNESFDGKAVGQALMGVVVFDLGNVERVTSFGIREWLAMLTAARKNVRELYFARCTDAVINQVTMIRSLLGGGRIVSFFAPYLCRSCQNNFDVLMQGETAEAAIRTHQMPSAACPKCGSEGMFDDEPAAYLAFEDDFLVQPPRRVLRTLKGLNREVKRDIEKKIEGRTTTIKVQRDLDGNVRWRRILDGLEGVLAIDLSVVGNVNRQGARNLVRSLSRMDVTDVSAIKVLACPGPLQRALAESQALRPLIELQSAQVAAYCRSCDLERLVVVENHSFPEMRQYGRVEAFCKRCNSPLDFSPEALALLEPWLPAPARAPTPAPAPVAKTPPVQRAPVQQVAAPAQAPPTPHQAAPPTTPAAPPGCLGALIRALQRIAGQ